MEGTEFQYQRKSINSFVQQNRLRTSNITSDRISVVSSEKESSVKSQISGLYDKRESKEDQEQVKQSSSKQRVQFQKIKPQFHEESAYNQFEDYRDFSLGEGQTIKLKITSETIQFDNKEHQDAFFILQDHNFGEIKKYIDNKAFYLAAAQKKESMSINSKKVYYLHESFLDIKAFYDHQVKIYMKIFQQQCKDLVIGFFFSSAEYQDVLNNLLFSFYDECQGGNFKYLRSIKIVTNLEKDLNEMLQGANSISDIGIRYSYGSSELKTKNSSESSKQYFNVKMHNFSQGKLNLGNKTLLISDIQDHSQLKYNLNDENQQEDGKLLNQEQNEKDEDDHKLQQWLKEKKNLNKKENKTFKENEEKEYQNEEKQEDSGRESIEEEKIQLSQKKGWDKKDLFQQFEQLKQQVFQQEKEQSLSQSDQDSSINENSKEQQKMQSEANNALQQSDFQKPEKITNFQIKESLQYENSQKQEFREITESQLMLADQIFGQSQSQNITYAEQSYIEDSKQSENQSVFQDTLSRNKYNNFEEFKKIVEEQSKLIPLKLDSNAQSKTYLALEEEVQEQNLQNLDCKDQQQNKILVNESPLKLQEKEQFQELKNLQEISINKKEEDIQQQFKVAKEIKLSDIVNKYAKSVEQESEAPIQSNIPQHEESQSYPAFQNNLKNDEKQQINQQQKKQIPQLIEKVKQKQRKVLNQKQLSQETSDDEDDEESSQESRQNQDIKRKMNNDVIEIFQPKINQPNQIKEHHIIEQKRKKRKKDQEYFASPVPKGLENIDVLYNNYKEKQEQKNQKQVQNRKDTEIQIDEKLFKKCPEKIINFITKDLKGCIVIQLVKMEPYYDFLLRLPAHFTSGEIQKCKVTFVLLISAMQSGNIQVEINGQKNYVRKFNVLKVEEGQKYKISNSGRYVDVLMKIS